jgi:hypothetical protein
MYEVVRVVITEDEELIIDIELEVFRWMDPYVGLPVVLLLLFLLLVSLLILIKDLCLVYLSCLL